MIQFNLKHCPKGFLFLLLILLAVSSVVAQTPVEIRDDVNQHIFTYKEIGMLEDPSGRLSLEQVRQADQRGDFKASTASTPQTLNLTSNYWFKIKIKGNAAAKKHYIMEFFDQTIDEITVYMPDAQGTYQEILLGDQYPFAARRLKHKNFEIPIENTGEQTSTYYIKIKSTQIADAIIVLRSVDFFIAYALNEYLFFGVFYGMILVFSLYNLVLFFSMKQKEYLFYVIYILSVGVYEMSTDGIAYQYLWPNHPEFNQIAYAVALCSTSVFALLFTRQLLHLKEKAPKINRIIVGNIILRILFFFYCLLFDHTLFNFKFLEVVPLSLAFFAGIYIYSTGYQAARFFVLGYSVLFIGFILKFLIMLGYGWLNFGVASYYSLSFSFVAEMVLFSFAIADQLRLLKDNINRELESKVKARTHELSQKSLIIEAKNTELEAMNALLKSQAEEISRMNVLLEMDNQELNTNVEKVTRARVMSAEMDFEEFSKIYPDKETCYGFLADLKWKNGYACRKCKHTQFYTGHAPYSRRCSKCGYEESVTSYSIFHNTRIPINKAFYMVYLIYTTKGKASSHKISEVLDMRQSTCWTYSSRVKTAIEEKKSMLRRSGKQGWSQLIMD